MVQTPFVPGRPSVWMRAFMEGFRPDMRYLPRLASLLLQGTITTPLRVLDAVGFSGKIKNSPVKDGPIFLVGFWRSGTTFAHEVLCRDQQFGRLTLYRALAPEFATALRAMLQPAFARFVPSRRPMDSVALSIDSPQEEELALLSITHANLYQQLFYPRNAEEILHRYGVCCGMSPETRKTWAKAYDYLLRTVTWESNGKQLLLKNPANTARIHILREMYPKAKFIHVHRNPFDVFVSTVHLFKTLAPYCALQSYTERDLEDYIITLYKTIMKAYLAHRIDTAMNDVFEVSFEELEEAPMEFVTEVYGRFGLDGLRDARRHMEKYLEEQSTYRKNNYSGRRACRERVAREWGFAFDAFGYSKERSV